MSFLLPGRTLPPLPGMFRALRHRDFRLLWTGQILSLTGSWMQSAAQGWLVLKLTGSPLHLGWIGFCTFIPGLLFALPAGVAADRFPRRTLLLGLQTVALLLAATMTVLTWTGVVQPWHIALLALGTGTVIAFEIPIRQSFLQVLVGKEDLPNAIALNSLAFNSARMLGPTLAGFLLAFSGEEICFGLNTLSFTAVLIALFLLHSKGEPDPGPKLSWQDGIRAGLSYASGHRRVRTLLGLVMISSIFAMPYSILIPIFARDILAAGSEGLGLLMGAAGLGAMGGALALAARRSVQGTAERVTWALMLLGVSLIVFAWSTSLYLSMACMFLTGVGVITQLATSNTYLQLTAPGEMRGRIISLFMLSLIGMAPFGSLLSGAAARSIGAPLTLTIGGVVCVLAGVGAREYLRNL
jgi:MFS family permease